MAAPLLPPPPTIHALMAWLGGHGMDTVLVPGGDAADGRTLCPRCDVQAGDVVLALPLHALVTPASVASETPWGRAAAAAGVLLSGPQWLTGFLARVYTDDSAAGAQEAEDEELRARWAPYLASLPRDYADCPGHRRYPPSALVLAAHLHPAACDRLAAQERVRGADYAAVRAAWAAAGRPDAREAALEWAWWTVNTRSITVPAAAGRDATVALAPFLDLLNHAPSARTTVTVEGSDMLVLRSGHAAAAGREYLICYGDHGNAVLWVEYGFVVPGHPHDPVPAAEALARLVTAAEAPGGTAGAVRLREARRRAWARCETLGLARDLGWASGGAEVGEPSWTLWRTAAALAWAEASEVSSSGRSSSSNTRPLSSSSSSASSALDGFLLGETEVLPPTVHARALDLLHAMATHIHMQLQARAATAPRADPPSVCGPLWRWHADQVATAAAAAAWCRRQSSSSSSAP
jgi:hypothetical protein